MKFLLILGVLLCLARGEDNKATLKSLVVISDIKVRYARTVVSAEYYNDKNSPAIADFHVILPDRAYISNFSMEMNGNVSVGEVQPKAKAKKIYEEALKRGESAGHVSVEHWFTKQFDMRVNVEPNVKVVFNLTYEELLKRTNGHYSHRIFLSSEIIDKLLVEVFISEPQDIKVLEENIDEEISIRSVDYIDNRHVYIKFDPSREEQQKLKEAGNDGEFIIEYDVDHTKPNLIYTLDGYFVHFFTPDDEPIWPKNIIFMVDVSGSMRGRKLRQVRTAMLNILSSLDPHKDSFTFGTFNGNVSWQHSESLKEANKFIQSLKARGDTNINDAMIACLEKFEKEHASNTADILFFLTDGEPTSGVTDKESIRQNIKEANKNNVLIFTLGFGEDCDHQFLKNIATDNNGFSRKIYNDEDGDVQIKNMFNEISSLLLKNVIITYVDSSIDVGKLTKNEFKTIFNGTEIAIAGPIKRGKKKRKTVMFEMRAENAQRRFVRRQKLEFLESELDEISITMDDIPKNPNLTHLHRLQDITEKTWAYLRLKKMFEDGSPEEDIVALAIEYGFVTPLTSMVVTKKRIRGDEPAENDYNHADDPPSSAQNGFPGMSQDKGPGMHFGYKPMRAHHARGGAGHVPGNAEHTIDAPDAHARWIRKYGFIGRTATPQTTPTTTIVISTTTPTPTPSVAPHLPRLPAIVVKPPNCDLMLCVSQKENCINRSKVLLLSDRRAGVKIFGEAEKNSSVTCMDDLYKITLITKRTKIEFTPTTIKVNKKIIDARGKDVIHLPFKKFFKLDVFFNRKGNKETISLKFFVKDHLRRASGLYGRYARSFDCKINGDTLSLSNMKRRFTKVTFTSPESGFDNCYM